MQNIYLNVWQIVLKERIGVRIAVGQIHGIIRIGKLQGET